MMQDSEIARLSKAVNFQNMSDPTNVLLLGHLTREEREEFSLRTKSLVLYFGAEVAQCQEAEENAAMAARPAGYALEDLNGLNIGCGDRLISPYLTPVDIMRLPPKRMLGGEHGQLSPCALLALLDDLPFRHNSIDYIVSLHTLEHTADPVAVLTHWLDIVKPGGGVGIVLPDWRYTWNARYDGAVYGHKWNSTPELVQELFDKHFADRYVLQSINTYDFKLSFDFVIRKPGDFVPFSRESLEQALSGSLLAERGEFLG